MDHIRDVRAISLAEQEGSRDEQHVLAFYREEIEGTIPERFARVVKRFPDRIAVKTDHQILTYSELDHASNQIAHAILAQRGSEAEPIVLLLEYDILQPIALLGVLKAGKCYALLPPSFSYTMLQAMCEDLQAPMIVTNHKHILLASELAPKNRGLLNCDELEPYNSHEDCKLLIPPSTCAQVLYTSGSTGKPKGIIHTHRTVLHRIMTWTNQYHICAKDRWLYFGSLGVGRSTIATLGTLLNGATLYFFDLKHQGLAQLAIWLVREKITIYHSLPTVFRRLIDVVTNKETFANIRFVILFGENVYKRDIQLFQHYFSPQCLLHVGLASTETNSISEYLVHQNTQFHSNLIPVGYAAEDKEILLLDEYRVPVGVNQIGEIAVRSQYLSPGYWRNPELTRQKFLPDPEGGDKRIYLTGDLGRMRPDGCLEYLGRKDFMVKIRGHRVELAEVEAAFYHLDGIKEAVVVAHSQDTRDTRLTAYVVPSRQPAPTVSELRQALAAILPDYMIPSTFMLLDALPLTPTGKVDRQALPEPNQERPELATVLVSPRDELEHQLAQIFEGILQVRPVGVRDNFFDLGGDSILALRLVAQIENTLGKTLPLPTLLQAPTIVHLAEVLRQEGWTPLRSSLVAIQPGGSKPPFFCVPPAAATALRFVNFARCLGSDQPFYGLQPLGLDRDDVTPHTRVEDMATYYLNEICQLQPEGPYYLGGQCFGGIVAFEMAQQLVAQGQQVALLAIFDTRYPPGVVKIELSLGALVRHYWQRGKQAWYEGEFWQVGGRKLKHWLRKYGKRKRRARLWQRVVSPVAGAIARLQVWDTMKMPQRLRIRRVEQAHHEARRSYRPRVYPGKITFFWSRDTRRGLRQEWARWSTEPLEIHVFPGRHNTMMQEPHIRVVAEQLRVCIEQAQAASIQVQTRSHPQRDASRQPDAEDRT